MIDRQAVAYQILEIIPTVTRTITAELRQTGQLLNPAHLGVMLLLDHHAYNLSELAEYQNVSLPTMSNTVTKLEQLGWVQRTRSERDRRVVMVELTPAGRHKLELIGQEAQKHIRPLLDGVSEEACQTLAAGLAILQEIFMAAETTEVKED